MTHLPDDNTGDSEVATPLHEEGSIADPPTSITISSLMPVDIRAAWPTEPHHFTPWLLENPGVLSDVLGVEIELDDKEHKVGTFSLDLIGRVAGSDKMVIVENQYGATDHGHLGQIMTYAGGTDPTILVWIAESFRDEHRAALDWLNANTPPGISFFGIELSVVRVKDGPSGVVAPLLSLVCQPNEWEKLAKAETGASTSSSGTSTVNVLYRGFWDRFLTEAKVRGWSHASPPAQNWLTMPTGIGSVQWGVSFATFGCRSELYFGHSDTAINEHRFGILSAKQAEIQKAYGDEPLIFDPLPENIACRIEARLHGPKVTDEECWEEALAWMMDSQDRLRKAVAAAGGVPAQTPG